MCYNIVVTYYYITERKIMSMSKNKTDRVVYTEVVSSVETGEVMSSRTMYRCKDEPEFVKLYIDCLFTVKGLRKGLNPIFLAFLQYMTYADVNGQEGGQLIFTNKALKMQICNKLGLGIDSINKALSDFVKAGVFKRIAPATYQVNPNIVGKGSWSDIKSIRANFDFNSKEVVADIVKYEEEEMTNKQTQLEEQYQLSIDDIA